MKDHVIKFLGDLPKSGSEQFNQALELFRKGKNHDAGKVRYYNTLGFSQDRLDGLLYDLKKLHSITDIQVANAKRKSPVNSPLTPEGETPDVSNDSEKETLEITSEELGTKELSEKGEEHIAVNQIDVNEAEDVSTPLDVTASKEISEEKTEAPAQEKVEAPVEKKEGKSNFEQKLIDFDLATEKYNSIKSFAAEVSNAIGVDPANQKAATLTAFIEEAKKKLAQS